MYDQHEETKVRKASFYLLGLDHNYFTVHHATFSELHHDVDRNEASGLLLPPIEKK